MRTLHEALAEFVQSNFHQGDSVRVKELRDRVAARFISDELPLSSALAVVRTFVQQMVDARFFYRTGSGVYTYWPRGNADETLPYDFRSLAPGREARVAFLAPAAGVFAAFESVASLARSDSFLVQRNLSQINVAELEELSL